MDSTTTKATLLEQIAGANRVNLQQLKELEKQMEELARAGIIQDRVYTVHPSLAQPLSPHYTRPLANAAALFRSR